MTTVIFTYWTSKDYLQKHTDEIPMKFDLWVYGFNNMAAKLTFTMESSQLVFAQITHSKMHT